MLRFGQGSPRLKRKSFLLPLRCPPRPAPMTNGHAHGAERCTPRAPTAAEGRARVGAWQALRGDGGRERLVNRSSTAADAGHGRGAALARKLGAAAAQRRHHELLASTG